MWTSMRRITMANRTGCLETFSLSLLLLVVLGWANSIQNIALEKNAYQSTRYKTCYPSLAVDGFPAVGACYFLESMKDDERYSHTLERANSWWRVDMEQPYYIYEISLCNRGGSYNRRLSQTYILSSEVTQSSQVTEPSHHSGSGWTNQHYFGSALGDFTTETFSPPFYARHVAIYGGIGKGITLREVEIYGFYLDDVEISTTGNVTMSTIELSIEVTGISNAVQKFPIRVDVLQEKLGDSTERESQTFVILKGTSQPLTFIFDELYHSIMYRYTVELFIDDAKFKETSEEFTTLPFTCENPDPINASHLMQQTANRTTKANMVDLRLQWLAPSTGCLGYEPETLSYTVALDGEEQKLALSVNLTDITLTLTPFTNCTIDITARNYQNMTTTTRVSVETIQTVPDGGPQDVSLYPHNTSCVLVKLRKPPKQPNGVITSYSLHCTSLAGGLNSHNFTVEPSLPTSQLSCGYTSGSRVVCEIFAYTRAGPQSIPTKVNSTTQYQIEARLRGSKNNVLRGHSGFFEISWPDLNIYKLLADGLTIKAYRVIVFRPNITNLVRSRRQTHVCTQSSIDVERAGPPTFYPLLPHREAANCNLDYYLAAVLSVVRQGELFVIGDGQNYGGVENIPLEEGAMYQIFFAVDIRYEFDPVTVQVLGSGSNSFTVPVVMTTMRHSPSLAAIMSPSPSLAAIMSPRPSLAAIIGGVTAGAVVLILAAILIWCWKRRAAGIEKTNNHNYESLGLNSVDESSLSQ